MSDFFSALGDSLSGTGTTLGNVFGSDQSAPVASPVQAANTADASQSVVDPSTVAQAAIAPGQDAPTTTQTQNPQGQQGQQSQQFAPQSAVDTLRKALQKAAQARRGNVWQLGGDELARQQMDTEGPSPGPPTPKPPIARPVGAPPFLKQSDYDLLNSDEPIDIPNFRDAQGPGRNITVQPRNPAAQAAGEGAIADATGQGKELYTPQSQEPRFLSREQMIAEGLGDPEAAPAVQPQGPAIPQQQAPAGGPSLGGIIQSLLPRTAAGIAGLPLAAGGAYFGSTTPAETGELPEKYWPKPKEEEKPTPEEQLHDRPPVTGDHSATTRAPVTGKPIKTVDPKTNKPVDPRTGAPLPTKKPKEAPPGEYQPKTGVARDKEWRDGGPAPTDTGRAFPGPMMRDMSGFSTAAPHLLGDLARFALPLMAFAMMGGFGGGRRRGGWDRHHPDGWHPGGAGHWPYHHPEFGWDMHGHHPGGGWLPMHPDHMRELRGGDWPGRFGGPVFGPPPRGGMDPFALAAVLGGMGGGQQQGPQGQQQGPQGQQGQQGPSNPQDSIPPYDPYYDKGKRYQNPSNAADVPPGQGPDGQPLPYTAQEAKDFASMVSTQLGDDPNEMWRVLAGESDYGQNYTNNYERDRIPSYGPFQLHDSGPGSVGNAFKQATGLDPRDPKTWKAQIVFALQWAHTHGWGAWGAAAKQGIPQWAGINRNSKKRFAWDYTRPDGGMTATGGNATPNPQGNPPKAAESTPSTDLAYSP